ncbi:MAG: hypothetical protein JSS81_05405 [Acidobacteria bacterium]|nr:hypothetical protein [Acidobacteriota bacterium]
MIETNIPSDGWTGPAFAFAEISGQNSYDWIDDVDTQTKRYSPEKAVLAHFEDCQMGSGNRAVTKNGRKDFVIKDFTTYETKDRLYAYLITGWAVTGPGENTAAAASSLIFLDEKGDGRFERRCGVEEVGSLPQWVRDLGTLEVKSKR